jgi:hypothetical protein
MPPLGKDLLNVFKDSVKQETDDFVSRKIDLETEIRKFASATTDILSYTEL